MSKKSFFERKVKSPFMIFANFQNILAAEGNRNQNFVEPYTKKYQKHSTCSCGYKLVCVVDKFSKDFKTYLDDNAVLWFY